MEQKCFAASGIVICQNAPYPVVLSAVRVPASWDERKSKDSEDVSPAMPIQGVLQKTFLSNLSPRIRRQQKSLGFRQRLALPVLGKVLHRHQ
jgi:hypothetical protein